MVHRLLGQKMTKSHGTRLKCWGRPIQIRRHQGYVTADVTLLFIHVGTEDRRRIFDDGLDACREPVIYATVDQDAVEHGDD